MPVWELVALVALMLAAVSTTVLWAAGGPIWPLVAALGATAAYMAALTRRDRRRLARARAALEALGAWPPPSDMPRAPAAAGFLTQDDYADLLNADGQRIAANFAWNVAAGLWDCRTCHRKAEFVSVFHSIWDGPFDEAGSGIVDRRDLPWCVRCEKAPPSMDGRPIRLPWLDQLPVRLRAELFERAAFHRLPVQVERYRPPAIAPEGQGEGGAHAVGP